MKGSAILLMLLATFLPVAGMGSMNDGDTIPGIAFFTLSSILYWVVFYLFLPDIRSNARAVFHKHTYTVVSTNKVKLLTERGGDGTQILFACHCGGYKQETINGHWELDHFKTPGKEIG